MTSGGINNLRRYSIYIFCNSDVPSYVRVRDIDNLKIPKLPAAYLFWMFHTNPYIII